jgi:hypothetical protein
LRFIFLILFSVAPVLAQTTVRFSADSLQPVTTGPFPADALTVGDPSQLTALRVNLPPAVDTCDGNALSVCSNTAALNQLDGFSVNPRIMICFSNLIDVESLPSGLSIRPLQSAGAPISITQIIFDPISNCAFGKPTQILDQQRKYLLLATNAILDATKQRVVADPAFQGCLQSDSSYCVSLAKALKSAVPANGVVVAASLFTTMTATSWLEKAWRQVRASPFLFNLPAGLPNTFQIASLTALTWLPADAGLPPQPIPLSSLSGVGSVSFGLFFSPNYLATGGPWVGAIPNTPTGEPIALPKRYTPISFHVFLPPVSGGNKIPVVIYGHGLGDDQFGAPTYIASTLARRGFATLAMEITGHGYGGGSVVKVTGSSGQITTELTPGRGVPLTPGALVGSSDGCIAPGAVAVRDCGRQTAVDLFALVATIRATNGLGLQLDPKRIYYVGQSFGSTYGTLFQAVEPALKTAVLNVAGGTSVDVARLAITGRPLAIGYLEGINPALLNGPSEPYFHDLFNDNYAFRGNPPITTTVTGAIEIQSAFEAADWLGMLGDPLAFGPHLRQSPLAGNTPKATLFQFGFGDLEVPNPTESALVLAAKPPGSLSFFHFERAVQIDPGLLSVGMDVAPGVFLPVLPHRVLSNPTLALPSNAAELSIATAWQRQVADFLSSDGGVVSDPNAYLTGPFLATDGLFEANPVLPEALNFLQVAP